MKSTSSLSLSALAIFFLGATQAAPNSPWGGNDGGWGHGGFPNSWPVPSWIKPGYSPTATAVGPSGSSLGVTATATATASATGSATATGGVSSATPSVTIKNGTVVGVHDTVWDQDYFLGVPYAQPPVGDLRLRVPHSINSTFSSVVSAIDFVPECVGYGSDQWPYPVSEDCLYVNIIRPANYSAYKEPLPVAFWLHGGGWRMGGNADRRYNMSFIVQNSVEIGKPFIAVQVNYRLSAWGFLAGDQVSGSGNTNLGLRDQRLAMHWVQENIAAFGGDPAAVTIWGESAGSASVGMHLVAYNGRDDKLFRAGIMESGNSVSYVGQFGSDHYQPYYDAIVRNTNCSSAIDTLGCIRSLPFNTLNTAFNTTNSSAWFPIVDGDILARYSSVQLKEGAFVHVPIISGANTDEGVAFGLAGINTTAQFTNAIQSGTFRPFTPLAAPLAQQLATTYLALNICDTPPSTLNCSAAPAALGALYRYSAAYGGDATFIANRRLQCETWASAGIPAYCFRFNAQPAGNTINSGITHFEEVAFVFDNTLGVGYPPLHVNPFQGKPQSYLDLANLMSKTWASFISTMDPNGWTGRPTSAPAWPRYSLANPSNLVFDANVTGLAVQEPDTFRKEGIALINSLSLAYQR